MKYIFDIEVIDDRYNYNGVCINTHAKRFRQLGLLSPTLGITKEITSRGQRVLDMEY